MAKGLGLPKQSLAALAYMYCGVALSKKWELLSSNWDGPLDKLSQDSIWYAANDALYALKIFEKMVQKPVKVPDVFPDFNKGFTGFRGKKRVHEVTRKPLRGNYKPKKTGEQQAVLEKVKDGNTIKVKKVKISAVVQCGF